MPALDIYHKLVKKALVKTGWIITHDPYKLQYGFRKLYIDLGAEKLIAAEKDNIKIALEIKSFLTPSPIKDLEEALGQYQLYRLLLNKKEPERTLFLAMPEDFFETVMQEPLGQLIISNFKLKMVIFNQESGEIKQWLPKVL